MDLRTQSDFLAALLAAVLAVAVALRATQRRHALLFAVVAGNVSLLYLAAFLSGATGRAGFLQVALAVAAVLPVTAHRFFQAFLTSPAVSGRPGWRQLGSAQRLSRVLGIGTALAVVAALSPLGREPLVRGVLAAWTLGAVAFALHHVWERRDTTPSRIERVRLTYVAVGGVIALAFALTGLLPGLSGLWAAVGNAGIVLYVYFLSQAILRHRLLDLNELLGRIVLLTGLALVVSLVFGLVVAAVGDNPALLVFDLLLATFVLMTLLPALLPRLERQVMAAFFAERYELLRALERLRRELPGLIDVRSCAVRVLDRLYDTNRVTHASIYLLSEDGAGYRLVGSRGPEPAPWLEAAALREFVEAAQGGQKAVLRETVDRRITHGASSSLVARDEDGHGAGELGLAPGLERMREALVRMNAGLCVPLLAEGRMVGVLNLQDERVYEAYSTDEIAAIIQIAELAATVVENSRLYERLKERDRLAALGEMAAGLAHEIRNPLGALKAAAQYLEPEGLPGDQGEFLRIILDETERLNGVVTQFLDYARPLKAQFIPTDLNDVVRRTLRLLEARDIPPEVELVLALDAELPPVAADPEQLRQVLLNLVLNALQAMERRGRLEIRTVWHRDPPQSGAARESVELRVRDSGPGIPAEVRESLFIPFFTTKERGTGLGLPISQRIVQNHQGTLEAVDRRGPGAEFVVRLPAAARAPASPEKGVVVPLRRGRTAQTG